ncbi:DNA damage-binding protein 1-like [Toxorhynchites rutilus septentrionalis]|uniref:DNA damage-binding protein 1-like n=1 Tax=Toxorhynchites rutilus septentrionalis TaxID=329112 RepID=UPI00247A1023|nr:DNA damage-binding protein 1-like [Toxorhynchites rutilus septentrionalis]
MDLQDSSGLTPSRQSASTQTTNVTYSSNMALLKPGASSAEFGQEVEIHNLLIIDQNTFELLHAHQFMQTEYTMSLISAKLGNDSNTYCIVGTVLVHQAEPEPKVGRIIIYHYADGALTQVSEKGIKGACYSLIEFNRRVLASINSTVRLYEWTDDKNLRLEWPQQRTTNDSKYQRLLNAISTDVDGTKKEAAVHDIIKIIEDLTWINQDVQC